MNESEGLPTQEYKPGDVIKDIDPSELTWEKPLQVGSILPTQEPTRELATAEQYKPGDVIEDIDPSELIWDKDRFQKFPEKAKLVAQEIAQGFAGPVATLAERGLEKLGVPVLSPEELARARAVSPITAGVAEAAGLAAGLLTGAGEAALLAKAGGAGAKLLTTGAQLSRARQAGAAAVRGAIELAGFSAGDEISNWINNDPNQSAASAISHIGLSSLVGAGIGGALAFAAPKWFGEVKPELEQNLQDFKSTVSGAVADAEAEAPLRTIKEAGVFDRLKELKPEAKEITKIGEKYNWPVHEGMIAKSKTIQMAEDALLSSGAPTIAGINRREAYQKGVDAVQKAVDEVTLAPVAMTETEVGNTLKQGLIGKLEEQYAPIKQLYQEIEPYRPAIPLSKRSSKAMSRTIRNIIKEEGLIEGTERYNFVKTFADGIENIENLQQLANFKTEVGRNSGPMTKDLAAIISEKLQGVEDRAIKRFADTMKTGEAKTKILDLIDKAERARIGYSQLREELQTLGNSLGKKKIYGPQNFLDFLEELNPQTLAKRCFKEGNTEFAQYLSKNFPEQWAVIRDYQRATLRNDAMKEGVLNTKAFIKNVEKLQPEMRDLLYTKEEQQLLKDAKKYLDSIPKSFNPSGTAHMSAFRAFFESPTGAAIANLRDTGILAFIKAAEVAVPGASKEAPTLLKVLGPKVAEGELNAEGFQAAVKATMAAIKQQKNTIKAADAIFTGAMPIVSEMTKDDLKKVDKKIQKMKDQPQDLFNISGDMGKYMPNHAAAISQTAVNTINLLNGLRPEIKKASPLDRELPLTDAQIAPYLRTLAVANQPLIAFKHIATGTLLPQDVQIIKSISPAKYDFMSQQLMNAMTKHVEKGLSIPYATRQSLSLFLGQPLDSTLKPESIQSIQATFAAGQQRAPAGEPQALKPKRSTAPLSKISHNLMTPSQAREARMNK